MNVTLNNLTEKPSTAPASELRVEGMTCNNCARKVTEAIQSVPGVQSVMVNVESQRASVRWQADATADPNQLIGAITAAGYATKLI